MSPQFLVTVIPNEPTPRVEFVTDQPDLIHDGTIVKPLILTKEEGKILNGLLHAAPQMQNVFSALCLTGWLIKNRPDISREERGQWYGQILTRRSGQQTFGLPYIAGAIFDSPLVTIADSFPLGKARLIIDPKDQAAFQMFTDPLLTKPHMSLDLWFLASDCIMAGWN